MTSSNTARVGTLTEAGFSKQPHVDIVFPVLPPSLDGIGDYTARFAEALTEHCAVRIHTAQSDFAPILGVEICSSFSLKQPWGIRRLVDAVCTSPPDWLLIQFNQFSYGRWGFNPFLPLTLRAIKQEHPDIRIAWMAHEDFVPVTSWKFAIMTLWQRWQFWMLGRQADLIFFSIDPWVQKYTTWFPDTPVRHLPVGSNIPYLGLSRAVARKQVGIDENSFVAGVFGTLGASRMVSFIHRAASALYKRSDNFVVLYVGPDGDVLQNALGSIPVIDAGRLPAEEVSAHLSAMDVHLAPYIDGVSTRRGSFMAGIQHGVASVSTDGELTDQVLRDATGDALLLAPVDRPNLFAEKSLAFSAHPERRTQIALKGQSLYDTSFSFEVTASRFAHSIEEVMA